MGVSDCVETIKSIKDDREGLSSSELCFRGLECRTPQGQKRRATLRFCSFDAVLDEQDAQWNDTENDTERIRDAYMAYSKPSHAKALHIGLEDEKEAKTIYREGDSCSLESPALDTPALVLISNKLP